jgi:hypothetical protein
MFAQSTSSACNAISLYYVGGRTDIGPNADVRLARQLGCDRCCRGLIQIDNRDGGALLGEPPRDCVSDAARSARDEGDATFEATHLFLTLLAG